MDDVITRYATLRVWSKNGSYNLKLHGDLNGDLYLNLGGYLNLNRNLNLEI